MVAPPIAESNNFQESFGHKTDQNRHLKDENK